MSTITKKELIDRIAESAGSRRVLVKKVVQQFLDEIVNELGRGNRLSFATSAFSRPSSARRERPRTPRPWSPSRCRRSAP